MNQIKMLRAAAIIGGLGLFYTITKIIDQSLHIDRIVEENRSYVEQQLRETELRNRRHELSDLLFHQKKYADVNRDGKMDNHEWIDFYLRLDLGDQIRFNWPYHDDRSIKLFEKAIESYEKER